MAVSIGSLRYDIVADTSQFTKGIVATRSELSLAKKMFQATRTPVEQYGLALKKLDDLHEKGKIDADVYRRSVTKLYDEFNRVRTPVKQLTSDQDKLNREIQEYARVTNASVSASQKRMAFMGRNRGSGPGGAAFGLSGGMAQLGIGLAVADQLRQGVAMNMGIESSIASFNVLTGSMEKAAALVNDLRRYDVASTFNFEDTTRAAEKLLNFGVATENVMPTLKALGDVAMGDADRLSRLALAFGQTTSMGRLMGQEVRQMVEAGFNPLQEIARNTGESMEQVKQRMEAGAISAAELANAFRTATSEGGKFFGMVDQRSQTTLGKLEMLQGRVTKTISDAFDVIKPLVTQQIDSMSTALSFFQEKLPAKIMGFSGRTIGNTPGTMAIARATQQKPNVDMSPWDEEEARARERMEERIAEIKRQQEETARRMNDDYLRKVQEQIALEMKRKDLMSRARDKIAEAFSKISGNTIKVDLAPSAKRGSREEYQQLAKTQSRQAIDEAKRHAKMVQFEEEKKRILGDLLVELKKLEPAEAI